MSKGRMEAFSDGVIAILMTIMLLELKAPHEATVASLRPLIPTLLSYVLSFAYLGIYWSNHHHLLQAIDHVDGRVLWANLHLLFWLSLIPGIAYFILTRVLIALHGRKSRLAVALGSDFKGKVSVVIYLVAIPLAFVNSLLSCGIYALVAIMWLIPDRRIERTLTPS